MKVKELKAVLNGVSDDAEVIVMSTYSGAQFTVDGSSISDGEPTGGGRPSEYRSARRGDVFVEAYFSDE
jgi:hypothetical protein